MKKNKISFFVIGVFFISCVATKKAEDKAGLSLATQLTSYKLDLKRLEDFYEFHSAVVFQERLKTFLHSYQIILENIDYTSLDIDQQVDYHLLDRRIKADKYKLEGSARVLQSVEHWVPAGDFLYAIAIKSKQGITPQSEELARQLKNACATLIDQIREVDDQNLSFSFDESQFLQEAIKDQKKALQVLSGQFNEYVPGFKKSTAEPRDAYEKQLDNYAKAIRTKTRPFEATPKGREALQRRISEEMFLPYSVDEIYQIAVDFFENSQKKVLQISNEMGYGNNWQQAYEKVKQSCVAIGAQADTVFKLQNEALRFAEKKNLVSIPELLKETWSIGMVPGFLQKSAPFFLGGPRLLISYPSLDMDKDDQLQVMQMNNPHFARSVLFHEIIPGHFMQYYMEVLYKPYRREFSHSALWSEGMAFYWELLFYEKGFAETAEDKLGMLFYQKLRAARVITSINYHTNKWSEAQCISFFKNEVGANEFVAASETDRAQKSYPIDYLIGGLEFMALKKMLVDKGNMSLIEFHDRLYKENFIPMDLLYYRLTNKKMPKVFFSYWKFD